MSIKPDFSCDDSWTDAQKVLFDDYVNNLLESGDIVIDGTEENGALRYRRTPEGIRKAEAGIDEQRKRLEEIVEREVEYECSSCGADFVFTVTCKRKDLRDCATQHMAQLEQKGWKVTGDEAVCPECYGRQRKGNK